MIKVLTTGATTKIIAPKHINAMPIFNAMLMATHPKNGRLEYWCIDTKKTYLKLGASGEFLELMQYAADDKQICYI